MQVPQPAAFILLSPDIDNWKYLSVKSEDLRRLGVLMGRSEIMPWEIRPIQESCNAILS